MGDGYSGRIKLVALSFELSISTTTTGKTVKVFCHVSAFLTTWASSLGISDFT
jgi:hypothetical protein